MKQLGVLDTAFINLEQTNTPQHIGGMGIYDPSTAPGGFVRFKQVIANFEQRLHRLPLFRTRLHQVPGNLDRPYWVVDENFDVEFHLRHIALPHPGDWRQLCIQIARLHSRPLDMSRPLWEAYIIEGLDNISDLPEGSFAVYTKMHHALVDGAGGQSFMAALHDLEPEPEENSDAMLNQAPIVIDHKPNSGELLARALVNQTRNTVSLASGSVSLARDFAKLGYGIFKKTVPLPDINAPKTRFNTPVGKHRAFEAATFALEDFKAIKNAFGVKINDVALAVVSGAMRRYLEQLGELPDVSLAAGIPMNMRTRRGVNEDNNQVGSVFCKLHTDIADPVERLRAIQQSATDAKEFGEKSPLVDAMKLVGVFSPWFAKGGAKLYSSGKISRHMPVNISTVVTNVPGANFDLYCAGARLVRYHGLGVLTPGVGLFHAIFSFGDSVTISILADREQLEDPMQYREHVEASFEELKSLAAKASQPKTKASGKSRKRKASSGQ
ncbi:WS/DGAT/MGAT family acyltransferase [Litorivivens lipolytica]|uniref:diacylglycerol O-acyltransferase n=1 Tax=Litorivivens lipolytica TaxID=1524264 RepID=A0A7W4W2V5_9GAMM|nr:wax ester/triacylglycerol synthase family O-acyltransferase [Litorivivens lipolytica]MBB3046447.1 WS/DGAT/MGAT family acyltransferase [Litorivivens lipolytica]